MGWSYDEFFSELRKANASITSAQMEYDANAGDDAMADISRMQEIGHAEGYLAGLEIAYIMLTGNTLPDKEA